MDSVKYLGVHIDNRLRFDKQLEKIHDELKKGISLLQCLQPYGSDYKTLKIDVEMRKIARLVTGCSKCTPRELLLWEADMLPSKRQIEKVDGNCQFQIQPGTNSLASPRSFWAGLIPRTESQLESVGLVQPDSIKPWIASNNVQISNSCGFM